MKPKTSEEPSKSLISPTEDTTSSRHESQHTEYLGDLPYHELERSVAHEVRKPPSPRNQHQLSPKAHANDTVSAPPKYVRPGEYARDPRRLSPQIHEILSPGTRPERVNDPNLRLSKWEREFRERNLRLHGKTLEESQVFEGGLLHWRRVNARWQEQCRSPIPEELKDLLVDVQTSNAAFSFLDRLKSSLERYSGEPWHWWPFGAPQQAIQSGSRRLQWICKCGERRTINVTSKLAEEILDARKLRSRAGGPSTTPSQNSIEVPPSSTPNRWFCKHHRPAPQNPPATEGPFRSHLRSELARSLDSEPPPTFYILFCGFRGFLLKFSQISVSPSFDDNGFVSEILARHRSMLGFWRSYFHPRVLDFCSFARYTRTAPGCLTKELFPELPLDEDYIYEPRLSKGASYVPPIAKHEWFHYLSGRGSYVYGCRCALRRIPKRKRRFVFEDHSAGREEMWGLFAEMRISALRMLLWTLGILVVGVVFLVWWLATHSGGDWQDASVPLMLTVSMLAALWAPLNARFNMQF